MGTVRTCRPSRRAATARLPVGPVLRSARSLRGAGRREGVLEEDRRRDDVGDHPVGPETASPRCARRAPAAAVDRRALSREGHGGALLLHARPCARPCRRAGPHLGSVGDAPALDQPVRRKARTAPLVAAAGILFVGALGGWLATRRAVPQSAPSFRRLTFRSGLLNNARFTPDGQTVVYGARWAGEKQGLYAVRPESPESRAFDVSADILAVSPRGEMAVLLDNTGYAGTLARMPFAGGVPRPAVDNVVYAGADWSPDGKDLAITRIVEGRFRLEFPIGKVLYEGRNIGAPAVLPPRRPHRLSRRSRRDQVVGSAGGPVRTLSTGWFPFRGGRGCWRRTERKSVFSATAEAGARGAVHSVDLDGKVRRRRAGARGSSSSRRFPGRAARSSRTTRSSPECGPRPRRNGRARLPGWIVRPRRRSRRTGKTIPLQPRPARRAGRAPPCTCARWTARRRSSSGRGRRRPFFRRGLRARRPLERSATNEASSLGRSGETKSLPLSGFEAIRGGAFIGRQPGDLREDGNGAAVGVSTRFPSAEERREGSPRRE